MARVYWITGLSGAGKTSIGRLLFEKIKKDNEAAVFLDGDTLRQVFGNDLGYSEGDRRKCALRYSRMCKLLSDQGITVVICTISMFHEIREWNRINISGYKEIYIKVSMKILQERDQKGLYSRNSSESEGTVSGVDFAFEEPRNPDIVIRNDGLEEPSFLADKLYYAIANH